MLYQFIYSFFQTIVKLITVTEEKLNVFLGKLFGPIVFVYDIFRDEINYSIKAAMVLCTDENVKQISFFFCNIYLFLFFSRKFQLLETRQEHQHQYFRTCWHHFNQSSSLWICLPWWYFEYSYFKCNNWIPYFSKNVGCFPFCS